MVLAKSPVSPDMWPVASPAAFAVVKVGNSAWLLRRLTPSRAMAAMVGAVRSSTMRKRNPSATNSTTLCGRGTGACAKTTDAKPADASVADRIAEPSNRWRMVKLRNAKNCLVPMPRDDRVTDRAPGRRRTAARTGREARRHPIVIQSSCSNGDLPEVEARPEQIFETRPRHRLGRGPCRNDLPVGGPLVAGGSPGNHGRRRNISISDLREMGRRLQEGDRSRPDLPAD